MQRERGFIYIYIYRRGRGGRGGRGGGALPPASRGRLHHPRPAPGAFPPPLSPPPPPLTRPRHFVAALLTMRPRHIPAPLTASPRPPRHPPPHTARMSTLPGPPHTSVSPRRCRCRPSVAQCPPPQCPPPFPPRPPLRLSNARPACPPPPASPRHLAVSAPTTLVPAYVLPSSPLPRRRAGRIHAVLTRGGACARRRRADAVRGAGRGPAQDPAQPGGARLPPRPAPHHDLTRPAPTPLPPTHTPYPVAPCACPLRVLALPRPPPLCGSRVSRGGGGVLGRRAGVNAARRRRRRRRRRRKRRRMHWETLPRAGDADRGTRTLTHAHTHTHTRCRRRRRGGGAGCRVK
jgi:hypothetical protein